MNSPHFPLEILVVILTEFLFGMAYNKVFEWARIPSAYAVVFGVAATVCLPLAFWWNDALFGWQWALLMLVSFAGSGVPMVYGFVSRQRSKSTSSHKRREWPNAARRAKEDALMGLNLLADGLRREQVSLADAVYEIFKIIGILNSV